LGRKIFTAFCCLDEYFFDDSKPHIPVIHFSVIAFVQANLTCCPTIRSICRIVWPEESTIIWICSSAGFHELDSGSLFENLGIFAFYLPIAKTLSRVRMMSRPSEIAGVDMTGSCIAFLVNFGYFLK
jgi:hypothetical protein